MTVGELIEMLREFDTDADVWGSSMGLRFVWHTRVVRGASGPDPGGTLHPIIEVVEDPMWPEEESAHPKGRIQ